MPEPDPDTLHLKRRLAEVEALATRIHGRLLEEVQRLGIDDERAVLQVPADAVYRLDRDPYSGEQTLVGEWRDGRGIKHGELLFHADGSFMVEQDIGQVHPSRPNRFIEAVSAWGRGEDIKSEARLLPMPE